MLNGCNFKVGFVGAWDCTFEYISCTDAGVARCTDLEACSSVGVMESQCWGYKNGVSTPGKSLGTRHSP